MILYKDSSRPYTWFVEGRSYRFAFRLDYPMSDPLLRIQWIYCGDESPWRFVVREANGSWRTLEDLRLGGYPWLPLAFESEAEEAYHLYTRRVLEETSP